MYAYCESHSWGVMHLQGKLEGFTVLAPGSPQAHQVLLLTLAMISKSTPRASPQNLEPACESRSCLWALIIMLRQLTKAYHNWSLGSP